jgi:hypothetical protein
MGLCALVIVAGSSAAQAQSTARTDGRHVQKPLRVQRASLRLRAQREAANAARSLAALKRLPPKQAICRVFEDRYCGQALRVARCESRFRTNARNGQYRGLFQMGASERRRFGHGLTAIEQSRAAHRYFVLSGRDWSPWSCKPWW